MSQETFFFFSHSSKVAPYPLKFYRDGSSSVTSLGSTDSNSLAVSAISAVTSSTEIFNPLKVP